MQSRQPVVALRSGSVADDLDVGGDAVADLSVSMVDDRSPTEPGADIVESAMNASRALLAVVVKSLAPILEEITPGQLRALVILGSQGSQRAGVLAGMLGVHPSTFTRTVDRLAAGGWVARSENPDSRREVLVELTPRGERAVAAVTRGRRRELAQVLAGLTPDEQRRIADGFELFAKAFGEPNLVDLARLGG
jgi:DNA-binding MarR family transcriptional regulator